MAQSDYKDTSDEIQETIVNSEDLREEVYEWPKDPIFHCIGQLLITYDYNQYGKYKKTAIGTGTVFHVQQIANSTHQKAFVLTAAHNAYHKIMHCKNCNYYMEKNSSCDGCGEVPTKDSYKYINATDISFKRRSISANQQEFGTPEERYNCHVEYKEHREIYTEFPSIKSGYDWCILSFICKDNYYEQYVSNITIRPTCEIWNKCARFNIFGYPCYTPLKKLKQNEKRTLNNGMYGMSSNQVSKMKLEMDDMGTINLFLRQSAIDTEGGQSGAAIFCKTEHFVESHSIQAKTIIFSIHVGGSVKGKFNVGTIITNDILCKIYNICGIPTNITRVTGMDKKKVWNPMKAAKKVTFKVHVGIDFGEDGTGIAFAFPDGKIIWQQSQIKNANIKEKTSMLLDPNPPYKLIAFGLEATKKYISMSDKKLLYFENFKSLLHKQQLNKNGGDYGDEKQHENKCTWCLKAENETLVPTQIVLTRALEYVKLIVTTILKNSGVINNDGDIQWIITVPDIVSNVQLLMSLMSVAAEQAGMKDNDIIDHVLVTTESECLSIAARKTVALEKKEKYILLDSGINISCIAGYIVIDEYSVKPITPTQIGNWGLNCIDDAFSKLLGSVFGYALIYEFKTKLSDQWKILEDNFNKATLYYDGTKPLKVALGNEFINFVENKNNIIEDIVDSFKYNNKHDLVEYDEGIIQLSTEVWDDLLGNAKQPMLKKIAKLLKIK
eukprot:214534_1